MGVVDERVGRGLWGLVSGVGWIWVGDGVW